MSAKFVLVLGSALGALNVMLGAFGAHGLKKRISTELLAIFETGARYHMYHVLALMAVGILMLHVQNKAINMSAMAFAVGILIFSGSLYVLAITGVKAWGAVTPVGGVFLIIGWVALLIGILQIK